MAVEMKRLVQAALDSVKAEEARGGNLTPHTVEGIVRAVLRELDMYTRIGVRGILDGGAHG